METKQPTVILTIIGLAALGVLVYFATLGNPWAYALLFAAWSIGCLVVGYALSQWSVRDMSDREQTNFINNAKENMALVSSIQSVQNQQNSTILKQLNQAARLPDTSGLLIDNVLFDELED